MPTVRAQTEDDQDELPFDSQDDVVEDDEQEEEKPKRKAPARTTTSTSSKSPLAEAERDEEQSLSDWLRSYGNDGPVRITLERKYPDKWKGIQVGGVLGTYDEFISAEQIEQEHGGGKFQVRVTRQTKTKNGAPTWKYAGARTFKIAGSPRIDMLQHKDEDEEKQRRRGDSEVSEVLRTAQSLVDRANARADRAQDPAMMETILSPLKMQVSELAAQNRELQARLIEKMGEKPDTSREDNVLTLWGQSNDEHQRRINDAYKRHEAELRQMREFHNEEIRRREERHSREVERAHDDSKMKIEILRSNHQQSIDSLKSAYEMRIAGLEDTIRRIEAEKAEARQEVVQLRAKKEQGPLEQIQALAALKNGMESVFGPSKEEDDTPTWLKALEGLGVDNLVGGIANRISTGGARNPVEDPEQQLVTIHGPDGETAQVPRHVAEEYRRRQAQQEKEQEGTRLDPNAVRRALTFMESAYRNNTSPGDFARSARSMIPKDILQMLSERGPDAGADHILDEYADAQSPLTQVNGRQWARKVVRFLLRGTDEEPAAPPPPAAEAASASDLEDL